MSVYIHVEKDGREYKVKLIEGRKWRPMGWFSGPEVDTIRALEKQKRGLSMNEWIKLIEEL
jgi:hypothetical protein